VQSNNIPAQKKFMVYLPLLLSFSNGPPKCQSRKRENCDIFDGLAFGAAAR
jgi:hypothetical protein